MKTTTYNPDTHVLVPKIATPEMQTAGLKASGISSFVWEAMWKAAPPSPEVAPVQGGQSVRPFGWLTTLTAYSDKKSWGDWLIRSSFQKSEREAQLCANQWAEQLGSWLEAKDVKIEARPVYLAAAPSPAVDAQSVRDAVLEEAAIVAENTTFEGQYCTTETCEAAAIAIRAMKTATPQASTAQDEEQA